MALPKLNSTYTYEMKLPVCGKTYKYRPYLVKEEKKLLMANETGDQGEMIKAMMDILDSCVEGLHSADLALADMEIAFAAVRGRSAGENVDVKVACSSCEKDNGININLLDVDAKFSEEDVPDSFDIETPDGTWRVKLRYPTFRSVADASGVKSEVDTTFLIMADMLDTLLTEDQAYRFDDAPHAERIEFLESLSGTHMQHIRTFMDAMPSAALDVKFKCVHCGAENEQELKGLQNFFG